MPALTWFRTMVSVNQLRACPKCLDMRGGVREWWAMPRMHCHSALSRSSACSQGVNGVQGLQGDWADLEAHRFAGHLALCMAWLGLLPPLHQQSADAQEAHCQVHLYQHAP